MKKKNLRFENCTSHEEAKEVLSFNIFFFPLLVAYEQETDIDFFFFLDVHEHFVMYEDENNKKIRNSDPILVDNVAYINTRNVVWQRKLLFSRNISPFFETFCSDFFSFSSFFFVSVHFMLDSAQRSIYSSSVSSAFSIRLSSLQYIVKSFKGL